MKWFDKVAGITRYVMEIDLRESFKIVPMWFGIRFKDPGVLRLISEGIG